MKRDNILKILSIILIITILLVLVILLINYFNNDSTKIDTKEKAVTAIKEEFNLTNEIVNVEEKEDYYLLDVTKDNDTKYYSLDKETGELKELEVVSNKIGV